MAKDGGSAAIVDRIERALAPHADRRRSEFMTGGYAPSRLACAGVPVPALRLIVRQFSRELRSSPPRHLIALARALVRRQTVETRQIGYELIARRPDAMAHAVRMFLARHAGLAALVRREVTVRLETGKKVRR
jgi:hypothetical protein